MCILLGHGASWGGGGEEINSQNFLNKDDYFPDFLLEVISLALLEATEYFKFPI